MARFAPTRPVYALDTLGNGDSAAPPGRHPDLAVFVEAHIAAIEALGIGGNDAGMDLYGSRHLQFGIHDPEFDEAFVWLESCGLMAIIAEAAPALARADSATIDATLDRLATRYLDTWQAAAGLKTFPQAVADAIELRSAEGERFDLGRDEWLAIARRTSFHAAREKARSMGIKITWDCELAKTPDGYYQIQGGIEYAIAKSLAAAPFADILWMETKTADLTEAKHFAHAIHAEFPDKMLAYNLSPSFNWDTTGLGEEEMRAFPEELGKLGSVFNFITYGGHQIDGLAGEEFASALRQDGMLALAKLQRKFRLLESPYQTPQTLVGGPRVDAALMASSGRTATTKAMGKGSTQFQHLVQTEVPTKLLEEWLQMWAKCHALSYPLRVTLRPHRPGSELLELSISGAASDKLANVIFAPIKDRRGRNILSVHDQNTFETALRKKRLMTLVHLFLIHRYKSSSVHYVSPTEENQYQAQKMKAHGLYSDVYDEVGRVIVADVNAESIKVFLEPDRKRLGDLIYKRWP